MSSTTTEQMTTPAATPPAKAGSGLAIAGLVLGVLAILGSFIPLLNIGAIILGVLAAVLGLIALLTHRPKGLSLAALLLGVIAIVISVVVLNAAAQAADNALNKPMIVEYIATSSAGEAKASWGTSGTSNESFTGNWTKSETGKGSDLAATLTVTGDLRTDGQTLTCEIKIDGKSVTTQTGEDFITCSASMISK
ncbi:MAG: hypothetical protein LBV06_07225 [Propionibacteriaceae bacterium]|jgi:hypothetical protein|nr:hypothetical protein [Propionibacteriaceae bacterium]